jgi:hypothetical protein
MRRAIVPAAYSSLDVPLQSVALSAAICMKTRWNERMPVSGRSEPDPPAPMRFRTRMGAAVSNARIIPITVMSLLILGFMTIQSKAITIVTVDVNDVTVGTGLVTITDPLGEQVEFYSSSAFDVYINGADNPATVQNFPATSLFDVFVTIDIPGTYPYCYSSAPCSPTGPTGQLDVVTPAPAALPLFATGLGGLGLLGWRRKRKAQAAA